MTSIRTIVKERQGRVDAESVDFQIQFRRVKVVNVQKGIVLERTARGCHASYSALVTCHHGRHSDVASEHAAQIVRRIKIVS